MAYVGPTQAIQTSLGDIVQRGVQQYQQAEQQAYLRKEREAEKALAFEDRYGIADEDFVLADTEIRTVNDAMTETMMEARNRYHEVFKRLQEDPTNAELKKRLSRIRGTVQMIRMNHEKMMGLGEKYVSALENDEVSGVQEDELAAILKGYDKGSMKIKFDQNDVPQYLFYDDEGKLVEVKKYTEMGRLDLMKKVKVDEEIAALKEKVGIDRITTREGGEYVKREVFGERQRAATADWIDAMLGTDEETLKDNDVLADLYYQATGKKKKENFEESERQDVKNFLLRKAENSFNKVIDRERDPAYVKAIDSGGSSGTVTKGGVSVTVHTTEDQQPKIDDQGNMKFAVSRMGSDGAMKPIEIKAKGSDIYISSIVKLAKGGLAIEGNQRVKMSGTFDTQQQAEQAAEEKYGSYLDVVKDQQTGSYYATIPYERDANETIINELGNQLNIGGLGEFDSFLNSVLRQKYGSGFEAFMQPVEGFEEGKGAKTYYAQKGPKGEKIPIQWQKDAQGNPVLYTESDPEARKNPQLVGKPKPVPFSELKIKSSTPVDAFGNPL